MSNLLIGLAVVGVAVGTSVAGLLVVRRLVPVKMLQAHHEVASAKFQVIGTLYAVLLAFVVVTVWQQFQAASVNVDLEAGKLNDLFRDAAQYPEQQRVRLRRQIRAYAAAVISDEWQAMADGTQSERAWDEYGKLWDICRELRPHDVIEVPVATEMLRRMSELAESRNLRMTHSTASIHPILGSG